MSIGPIRPYDAWKLASPYEDAPGDFDDGDPWDEVYDPPTERECFDCDHFRKPGPNWEGWCLRRKARTGDIDTCPDFVRDEAREQEKDDD